MRIAIIGAGFFGLATAWHLLHHPKFANSSVTIIDKRGIAGGASGVSAGLLHSYVGLKARLNWRGHEGVQSTLQLLEAASNAHGSPVYEKRGLLRIALTEEQKKYYSQSAQKHPNLSWYCAEEVAEVHKGLAKEPALYIPEAYTVFPSLYLEGLWLSCQSRGTYFEKHSIQSLCELDHFDLIIVATGAESLEIKELSTLPIHRLKGQILEFEWPKDVPPLSMAVTSQIYLIMSADNKTCIVGSTYEREYDSAEPDMERAKQLIIPELYTLFPPLRGAEPISCRAGFRASAPMHLPLVAQISPKCWAVTGLGSKGLLYHSMMSAELLSKID